MKKFIITSFVTITFSTLALAGVDGAACVSCHGTNWEKDAMKKSKVVAEMTHADIATALKGYKAGTYGGAMKGLMKAQVGKYSDEELDAFAQTIGK
ncbi:c-type cytochrome [Sulfurimonas sp.]|uniref:c-type cytochrome n=1 Tax=Sulfurimonas sp. TaxID=2022749 RepID=UPI003D103B20